MSDVWEKRIRRSEHLEKEWPFAAEILGFYRWLAVHQQTLSAKPDSPAGLEHCLEFTRLALDRRGQPGELARKARELSGWGARRREEILLAFWRGPSAGDAFLDFLALTVMQPWAMQIDPRYRPSPESSQLRCPRCLKPPVAGLLREDKHAETVRRTLVCSLCSLEWDFPRVICPGCKEERPEKLPRFTAQEIPWIQVEACDSCGRYLKGIDLTKNPDADPIVDELASTPLDAVAAERSYVKLTRNLLGL